MNGKPPVVDIIRFVAEQVKKLGVHNRHDKVEGTGVSIDHEYVVCYTKQFGHRVFRGTDRKTEQYKNPDNDPRGPWTSANMVSYSG